MSAVAKRELGRQVAPRYRDAARGEKSMILVEFVAAMGHPGKEAPGLDRLWASLASGP